MYVCVYICVSVCVYIYVKREGLGEREKEDLVIYNSNWQWCFIWGMKLASGSRDEWKDVSVCIL